MIEGDLATYLNDIRYGDADDGLWQPPSAGDLEALRSMLEELLAGSLDEASRAASAAGFLLIEFRDPVRGCFYLLRDAPNADGVSAGGTYVWNPAASFPTVIEVPHPLEDEYTSEQGIELYLDAEAALLILSGTHPRSDLVQSDCDGAAAEDYRRSDPSHSTWHLFHAAHQVAEDVLNDPLFIQLHGVGKDGYEALQRECGNDSATGTLSLLVNVSDGFHRAGGTLEASRAEDGFTSKLVDAVNADGVIRACLYDRDTTIYGGTRNTQGRYTNASRDPCTRHAPKSSGRFIHLEQSYDLRRYRRAWLNALITETLVRYSGE